METSHHITDLDHKLHFYDHWATNYDQVKRPASRCHPTASTCLSVKWVYKGAPHSLSPLQLPTSPSSSRWKAIAHRGEAA